MTYVFLRTFPKPEYIQKVCLFYKKPLDFRMHFLTIDKSIARTIPDMIYGFCYR